MTTLYNRPWIRLARGVEGAQQAVLALQTDLRRLDYLRNRRAADTVLTIATTTVPVPFYARLSGRRLVSSV
jgi:hypothetical protein